MGLKIQKALDTEGCPSDAAKARRFERYASELEWFAEALHARRLQGVPS